MSLAKRPSSRSDAPPVAGGSMRLMQHVREFRKRLLRACVAILVGAVAGYLLASRIQEIITDPYCDFVTARNGGKGCGFNTGSPLDQFMLNLKIALYAGLVIAAPVWLYQLWAFIAPGLHKRERRYGYAFAGVATPLFAAGFVLGFILVSRSMEWFLGINAGFTVTVDLIGYFDFVTGVMLLFGVGFDDRRRARRDSYSQYADDDVSPIEPVSPVDAPTWGAHRQEDNDEK